MDGLYQHWLALQCKMISGVSKAIVLVRGSDGASLQPVALWPESLDQAAELHRAAQGALRAGRGTIQHADDGSVSVDYAALPIMLDGELIGAIAVEVTRRPAPQQQAMLQVLQWGTAWLEVLHQQQASQTNERLVTALEILAEVLEQEDLKAAGQALVGELATRLKSERASLGVLDAGHISVLALSHSARFDERSNLLREITAAMEEAADQASTVVYPMPDEQAPIVTRAHADLVDQQDCRYVCTVPLVSRGEVIGVITLERADEAFEPDTCGLAEHIAALLGPVLEARRRAERPVSRILREGARGSVRRWLGPRHVAKKLVFSAAVIATLAVAFIESDYRVTADARLMGTVQRAVIAPQDGFVAEAPVRAGDRVAKGETLATLDDKDLRLERLKWEGKREQLRKEYRSALAEHDRASVAVLGAQIEQADAQIRLIEEQLSRTRLEAPFDGIVVSGDLTQSLGAPVARGDVLYEIAPEGGYRIRLDVDEREVDELRAGQNGVLALASIPDRRLGFTVTRLTPVAEVRDGRNVFQAEAVLDHEIAGLRPGMTGVGKVSVGERPLAWIWGHEVIDWLRMALWSYLP